jgi:hypothetical protein
MSLIIKYDEHGVCRFFLDTTYLRKTGGEATTTPASTAAVQPVVVLPVPRTPIPLQQLPFHRWTTQYPVLIRQMLRSIEQGIATHDHLDTSHALSGYVKKFYFHRVRPRIEYQLYQVSSSKMRGFHLLK